MGFTMGKPKNPPKIPSHEYALVDLYSAVGGRFLQHQFLIFNFVLHSLQRLPLLFLQLHDSG